ncbi:nuclear transport factor 2 family protein [Nodosilinea sp. LEGE 07088]|uniref:YybH family protein n=1 Tax=Nodosilinea sp. LEGE 07088 TaxID=2777968 RepID=UPI001880708E|nr:nuclear transport factor 2 family protein [Nodosilinea sp. LEGE 07088]MBE9138239.1 nuclear transport factor 2 family protein [Nodosilinea sp. LEGE 07088]
MITTTPKTQSETQIRQLIEAHTRAICTKDLEGIVAHYDPQVVIFDVKPPLTLNGIDACRQMWGTCLPYMPEMTGIEQAEMTITVSGDLALAHWLSHFEGVVPDHPAAQLRMRMTAACQRSETGWQIIHEHVSVPMSFEGSDDCADT